MSKENVKEAPEISNEEKINAYVEDLSRQMMDLARNYAARVSQEMGSQYTAGLLPFLQDVGQGLFKPSVRVAILPVKEESNEDGGTKSKAKKGPRNTTAKKRKKS